MNIDEEDLAAIRPALIHLIFEKKTVTLDSQDKRIVSEHPGWRWSRSTLWRALTSRLGFHFDRRHHGYYERLREDAENSRRRALYLQFMFKYQSEGRPLVYTDESWINRNCVPDKVWMDGCVDCEPPAPHSKGARWILIGAGSADGWIPTTFVMWKGNVQSEDYHSEMNSDVFRQWFTERLLPNVPPNACVVVDRAPYHTVLTPESKPAGAQWTRAHLAEWLVAHNAKDEEGDILTIDRLLDEPTLYAVEGAKQSWMDEANAICTCL